jgi:hypothetical protein
VIFSFQILLELPLSPLLIPLISQPLLYLLLPPLKRVYEWSSLRLLRRRRRRRIMLHVYKLKWWWWRRRRMQCRKSRILSS